VIHAVFRSGAEKSRRGSTVADSKERREQPFRLSCNELESEAVEPRATRDNDAGGAPRPLEVMDSTIAFFRGLSLHRFRRLSLAAGSLFFFAVETKVPGIRNFNRGGRV
jgi:hypothetical protein